MASLSDRGHDDAEQLLDPGPMRQPDSDHDSTCYPNEHKEEERAQCLIIPVASKVTRMAKK
ncbi:hypothetical protein AURDEDRAFT_111001 [Auricularia subglabra TFB-10046 SS5]|nr:hypothetical protein AURDEDRAFT_111001 [Auricularia subglabra TFB-10046 SS5]